MASATHPPARKVVSDIDDVFPADLQEVLAIRVVKKSVAYVVMFLGALSAVLGAVGVNVITDAKHSLTLQLDSLGKATEETQALNNSLRTQLKNLQDSLEHQRIAYGGALSAYSASLSNYQQAFTNGIREEGAWAARMQTEITRSQDAVALTQQLAPAIQRLEGSVKTTGDSLRLVRTQMEATHADVNTLNGRVIGGATVLVYANHPGYLHGTPFVVEFERSSGRRVIGFAVKDRVQNTIIKFYDSWVQDESHVIEYGSETYTVTLRNVEDHHLATDRAYVQVERGLTSPTHTAVTAQ